MKFTVDHINTEDLFSLIDGDLSPEQRDCIINHIKSCAECKNLMIEVLDYEKQLQLFFKEEQYPKCPSARTLLSYAQSCLESFERDAVKEHLSICPACQFRLEIAKEAIEDLDTFEKTMET